MENILLKFKEKKGTVMKKKIIIKVILSLSMAVILSACGVNEKEKPAGINESESIIAKVDIDPEGGADHYEGSGNSAESKYFSSPDFYNMKSDNNITIIEKFKTYQQTSEYSCGSATILMVIENLGDQRFSEEDIMTKTNCTPEYGTNISEIVSFFNGLEDYRIIETSFKKDYQVSELISEGNQNYVAADVGNITPKFSSLSLYTADNEQDSEKWVDDAKDSYFVKWLTGHLSQGHSIMVEWGDWDGHWQAIIGYDNMGTPGINDDILILADPYDTTDHWQDGYYYYSLERWFTMWKDRGLVEKPYQLKPYIIVEKVER